MILHAVLNVPSPRTFLRGTHLTVGGAALSRAGSRTRSASTRRIEPNSGNVDLRGGMVAALGNGARSTRMSS